MLWGGGKGWIHVKGRMTASASSLRKYPSFESRSFSGPKPISPIAFGFISPFRIQSSFLSPFCLDHETAPNQKTDPPPFNSFFPPSPFSSPVLNLLEHACSSSNMFHPSFGFLTLLFPLSFVSQRSSLSGELPLVEVTLSGLRSQSLTDKKDGVPSDKWRSESGSSASLFCYTFLQPKTFWFSPENLKVSIQQSTWATSGKNCPGPRYQTYTNCQVIVNPIILKCWAKSLVLARQPRCYTLKERSVFIVRGSCQKTTYVTFVIQFRILLRILWDTDGEKQEEKHNGVFWVPGISY